MHTSEWIALFGLLSTVLPLGIGTIVKLTRLVDAVESLGQAITRLANTDQDHELRLRELERARRDRR